MKQILTLLIISWIGFSCQDKHGSPLELSKDLTQFWDTITPLANPHKGWYHHLLDNAVNKYPIKDQQLFASFPGMDHLYLRLAWSYLEPEEGKFDWSRIDEVIEEYVPKGYGISFRVTCKETGNYPYAVGQQQDGVNFATPIWVKNAGAKGTVTEAWNMKSWNPVWDDAVYLEKLDNFHKAFAARYDGQPYVRYTDVGSIGDWGEGHTSFSTKIPPTVAEVKAHMDLHHKHYKNSLVVVTDDLLYYGKSKEGANELLDYALSLGFTLRDDSPLVDWYVDQNRETFSVSHPHFFEKAYHTKPMILELQHYHMIKRDGNWLGENGEDEIPGKNISGADIFRGAIKTMRATYIGYHGYVEEWFKDNPQLTGELLNMCGYWFFPVNVRYSPEVDFEDEFVFSLDWQNKGVARAYNKYLLWVKLQDEKNKHIVQLENANPDSWLPGSMVSEQYKIDLPEGMMQGEYKVRIKMTTACVEKRDVLLGLQNQIKDNDGFYELFSFKVKQ
jgi:hypothetical protein